MTFTSGLKKVMSPVTSRIRNNKGTLIIYEAFRFTKAATTNVFSLLITILTFLYSQISKKAKFRVTLMKTVYKISRVKIPRILRSKFFGLYAKFYKVKVDQMEKPMKQYQTFSQFFTRKVHPREFDKREDILISPADSKILKIQEIKEDTCQIIKGATYSLGELMNDGNQKLSNEDIQRLKKVRTNKLFQIIFYLAPGDYHRFHCPADIDVTQRKRIDGLFLSVNERSLVRRKKVYERNARICLQGNWKQGFMDLIMVGALNVGQIIVHHEQRFEKGDELGYFNLGSTVVMIFEAKDIKEWHVKEGDKVRYGQTIAQVKK